jgi:hypothetical protein
MFTPQLINNFLPPNIRLLNVENEITYTYTNYYLEKRCKLIYLVDDCELIFTLVGYDSTYDDVLYNCSIKNIAFTNYIRTVCMYNLNLTTENIIECNKILKKHTKISSIIKIINCFINIYIGGNTLNMTFDEVTELVEKHNKIEFKIRQIDEDFK